MLTQPVLKVGPASNVIMADSDDYDSDYMVKGSPLSTTMIAVNKFFKCQRVTFSNETDDLMIF